MSMRFATSDSPSIYALTRQHGWRDYGEHAIRTWEGPWLSAAGSRHLLTLTLRSWFALARCAYAIVAPVASSFSLSAAYAANVPVAGCCSLLRNASAFRRYAAASAFRRYASASASASTSAAAAASAAAPAASASAATSAAGSGHGGGGRGGGGRGSGGRVAVRHWWLRHARGGYCGKTADGVEGDCEHGAQGSWTLNTSVAISWTTAAAACTSRCAKCDACHYLSVSVRHLDCSWFRQCPRLHHDVPAFRSGPGKHHSPPPSPTLTHTLILTPHPSPLTLHPHLSPLTSHLSPLTLAAYPHPRHMTSPLTSLGSATRHIGKQQLLDQAALWGAGTEPPASE